MKLAIIFLSLLTIPCFGAYLFNQCNTNLDNITYIYYLPSTRTMPITTSSVTHSPKDSPKTKRIKYILKKQLLEQKKPKKD